MPAASIPLAHPWDAFCTGDVYRVGSFGKEGYSWDSSLLPGEALKVSGKQLAFCFRKLPLPQGVTVTRAELPGTWEWGGHAWCHGVDDADAVGGADALAVALAEKTAAGALQPEAEPWEPPPPPDYSPYTVAQVEAAWVFWNDISVSGPAYISTFMKAHYSNYLQYQGTQYLNYVVSLMVAQFGPWATWPWGWGQEWIDDQNVAVSAPPVGPVPEEETPPPPPTPQPGVLDFSAAVQEVVNRPGWQPGNNLLLLVQGVGMQVMTGWSWPTLELEWEA